MPEDTYLQDLQEEAQCLTIINAREEGKTAGESYEDISVNQCKAKMAKFVQKFANPDDADDKTLVNMDARAPYYLQQLEEIAAMKEPFLSQLQDQPQL